MPADDYVYSLGVYIQSLYSDCRYRDAIAMLPRYEQAMDCLESKDDIPDGLVDMRRASAYAAFASMLALEGDNRKADDLYRKLLETDYSKRLTADSCSYLICWPGNAMRRGLELP